MNMKLGFCIHNVGPNGICDRCDSYSNGGVLVKLSKDEVISQLQSENERLREENEKLKSQIEDYEAEHYSRQIGGE